MTTQLILQIHHTRDLPTPTREAIVRMCSEAHHTDFSPLFTYLPEDGLHVLAYLGTELVAHAVRTTRWAQPPGLPPLKTAYIDAVTTAEKHQGAGFGSAVMRRLADEINREDYQICALETDKAGFYTRLGWEVWPGPLGGRLDGQVLPTPEAQGHVLVLRTPRTPALELDGLLTIEHQGRVW